MVLDDKIRFERVGNDPTVNQVPPWFGKMRDT